MIHSNDDHADYDVHGDNFVLNIITIYLFRVSSIIWLTGHLHKRLN